MKKAFAILAMIALGTLVSVGFTGCGDAGGAAKTANPVRLIVTGPDANMQEPDVCTLDITGTMCTFIQDEVGLDMKVIPVSADAGMSESHLMDVIVTGYEVKFHRKDTGTDVPKTFTGNCSYYVEYDTTQSGSFVYCRADQKMMPPLSYLWQLGYEPDTGLNIIHTTVTITVWGRTLAGKEIVADPVTFLADFADWADDL